MRLFQYVTHPAKLLPKEGKNRLDAVLGILLLSVPSSNKPPLCAPNLVHSRPKYALRRGNPGNDVTKKI